MWGNNWNESDEELTHNFKGETLCNKPIHHSDEVNTADTWNKPRWMYHICPRIIIYIVKRFRSNVDR